MSKDMLSEFDAKEEKRYWVGTKITREKQHDEYWNFEFLKAFHFQYCDIVRVSRQHKIGKTLHNNNFPTTKGFKTFDSSLCQ